MSITANSLYRDTGNFFVHQRMTLVLMALLTSLITVIINHALLPGSDQMALLAKSQSHSGSLLEMIQEMTPEQQRLLLRMSAAGTFASLIGSTLLLGGVLTLIPRVTAGQRLSALNAIGSSTALLPRLLLLTFIMILVIQLGFTLFVLPGVLLCFLLSLSPVMMAAEKKGVFNAMRASVRFCWQHMRLVVPAVMLWLLIKMVLLLLAAKLVALPATLLTILLTALSNLASALLIIYLYRLYMLVR